MAVSDLVQALERDAAEQIRALLDGASSSAAELEAQASRRRDDTSAHALSAWRDECRARADEHEAGARRVARTRVLAARAAMLDRVRAALAAQLPAAADRVRPVLERAVRAYAGDRGGIQRDVATGVELELPNGTELVATLEALATREWPRLAAAIVAELSAEVTS